MQYRIQSCAIAGQEPERVESDSQAFRSEAQTRNASSARGVGRVERSAFSVWGLRLRLRREQRDVVVMLPFAGKTRKRLLICGQTRHTGPGGNERRNAD